MHIRLFPILFCITIGACKNDTGNSSGTLPSPSDSITTQAVVKGDTVHLEKYVVKKDSETERGDSIRTEKSRLRDQDCCVVPKDITACCCDKIVKNYQSLIKQKKWDEASAYKNDPFYAACLESSFRTDFEAMLKKAEDEVLGAE